MAVNRDTNNVGFIYGVDLVQVFIKCRVDIITHFREIVYMRFYVSISEKEFLHMIQLSTIFFSMKYMF